MKKNTTPADQRPDKPPEEPGRDESGLTDGPQSEPGLKGGRKSGTPDTRPPKKGAPGTTGAVGDDDAAEGL